MNENNTTESTQHLLLKYLRVGTGYIVTAIIGLVSVPIISWLVLPQEIGKLAIFTLYQTLSYLVLLLGFTQGFEISFYAVKDRHKWFWSAILPPLIFSSCFAVILLVFYKPLSIFLFEEEDFFIILMLAISMPFSIIDTYNELLIRIQEKGKQLSFLTIMRKVSNLILLFFIIVLIDNTLNGLLLVQVTSIVLIATIGFFINYKYWFSPIRISATYLKDLFKIGFPLIPTSIVRWLFDSMDRMSLKWWSTMNQTGYYSYSMRFVNMAAIFQRGVTSFYTPLSFKWSENNVSKDRFDKIAEYITVFMTILYFIIVIPRKLLVYIISENYFESINIFPFLLFIPILYTISTVTSMGIMIRKKTFYELLVMAIAALVNIIGNLILVPIYGAIGAAVTTAISYAVFFWVKLFISRTLWLKLKLKQLIINFTAIFLLAAISIAGLWYLEITLFIFVIFLNLNTILKIANLVVSTIRHRFLK